jgi:hypothetical protein
MVRKPIWEDKKAWAIIILISAGVGLRRYTEPFVDEPGNNGPYIALQTIGSVLILVAVLFILMGIIEVTRRLYYRHFVYDQSVPHPQAIQQPKVKICKNCYAVLGINLKDCPHCGLANL